MHERAGLIGLGLVAAIAVLGARDAHAQFGRVRRDDSFVSDHQRERAEHSSESSAVWSARLNQAREAEARGLLLTADSLYRSILDEIDADCAAAYEALLNLHESHDVLTGAENEPSVRESLGPDFSRMQTRHFVIYTDADDNWAAEQGERLERAHEEFFREATALGLRPLPLKRRLLCVLFDDREDFSRFARRQDRVREAWIGGYYSTTANYIVFYNSDDDSSSIASRRGDERPSRLIDSAGDLDHDGERYFNSTDDRMEYESRHDHSAAKTIHEAVHQLAHNTGVMGRVRRYPFWAAEGMATAFETTQPKLAFGPSHDCIGRRSRFVELLDDGELMPLDEFVCVDRINPERGDRADVIYHQSYALFRWLCRNRPVGLSGYLRDMESSAGEESDLPTGRLTSAEHLRLFERHFGPVETLEGAWLRAERAALR